jgi:hypothetical protein
VLQRLHCSTQQEADWLRQQQTTPYKESSITMNRIKLAASALFLFAAMFTQASAQRGGSVGSPIQLPKVTSVGLSAYGTGGANGGECPKGAMITAYIKTDGPCTVQYQWIYSWKAAGPVQTMTFTKAETRSESLGLTLATSTSPNFNGWVKMKVISPNVIESTQQDLSVSCTPVGLPTVQPGTILIKP